MRREPSVDDRKDTNIGLLLWLIIIIMNIMNIIIIIGLASDSDSITLVSRLSYSKHSRMYSFDASSMSSRSSSLRVSREGAP